MRQMPSSLNTQGRTSSGLVETPSGWPWKHDSGDIGNTHTSVPRARPPPALRRAVGLLGLTVSPRDAFTDAPGTMSDQRSEHPLTQADLRSATADGHREVAALLLHV